MNRRLAPMIALLLILIMAAPMTAGAQDIQPPIQPPGGVEQEPAQPPLEQPEVSKPDADAALVDPAGLTGPEIIEALLGNSISFQGLLVIGGNPANGVYDFRFRMYNAPVAGAQVGPTVTSDDQNVVNGLVTVSLDFGNVFNGTAYYMAIEDRPGANNGAYLLLNPRQALTPAAYSQYARAAGSVFAQTNASGVPNGDGFRLRFDNNFFAVGADALVVEKTDANTATPDGGIAFVNTGNDGAADPAMVVRGNGDVGVGLINPAYRLTVRDDNHQLAIVDADNANKTWTLSSHQASSGIGFWENGVDGRLMVEAGGNVGIGTTDPQSKLHVNNGDIRLTSPQYARLNLVATDPGSDVQMFMDARGDGTNRGQLGTLSNHGLVIFTNSAPRIVIGNTGDICIGSC